MGSEAAGAAASNSDGFGIGACSPAVKNAMAGLALALAPPALLAAVSSSSSLAGLWRLPPHISSRRFGGEASIGTRLSTVPSEGFSHDSVSLEKPRSSIWTALTARAWPDEAPSTTAISRLPLRVADATRL